MLDISCGVPASARALNVRPNITYQTSAEVAGNAMPDVAYSLGTIKESFLPIYHRCDQTSRGPAVAADPNKIYLDAG